MVKDKLKTTFVFKIYKIVRNWYKTYLLKKTFKSFSKNKNKILLVKTPLYRNIGDHCIAVAEKKFFSSEDLDYEVDEVPFDYLPDNFFKVFDSYIANYSKIVITGGGFLGNLWPYLNVKVEKILSYYSNRCIIIFPQTIYFNEEVGYKKAIECYNRCSDLTLFIRDKSYSKISDFFTKKLEVVPDIALYLSFSNNEIKRDGILLCFRNDKESVLTDSDKRTIYENCNHICTNVKYTDTINKKKIKINNRDNILNKKIDEFLHAQLVITDRLHGMIFSVITGTPCIVLDNISGKIFGVYDLWLSENKYITFRRDVSSVDQGLISDFMKKGGYVYNPKKFDLYWKKIMEAVN